MASFGPPEPVGICAAAGPTNDGVRHRAASRQGTFSRASRHIVLSGSALAARRPSLVRLVPYLPDRIEVPVPARLAAAAKRAKAAISCAAPGRGLFPRFSLSVDGGFIGLAIGRVSDRFKMKSGPQPALRKPSAAVLVVERPSHSLPASASIHGQFRSMRARRSRRCAEIRSRRPCQPSCLRKLIR